MNNIVKTSYVIILFFFCLSYKNFLQTMDRSGESHYSDRPVNPNDSKIIEKTDSYTLIELSELTALFKIPTFNPKAFNADERQKAIKKHDQRCLAHAGKREEEIRNTREYSYIRYFYLSNNEMPLKNNIIITGDKKTKVWSKYEQ